VAIFQTAAAAAAAVGSAARPAAAAVGIQGREVAWRGLLPDGWFGGNAAHIEEVIRDPDFEIIRKPMEWLLSRAKNIDAAAFHPDVSGIKSNKISLIQISDGAKLGVEIADSKQRADFWEKLRGILPEDAPPGSKTTLESQPTAPTTGGFPAFAAIFRTDLPNGASSFALFHCVDRGAGRMHMFELSADQVKFPPRRQEFDTLLRSVRYV
jgi:hypothetical protein